MAVITTHEDHSPAGTTRYELADDGTVTVTDANGTVSHPPTPETVAQVQAVVATRAAEAAEAARLAAIEEAPARIAALETELAATKEQAATAEKVAAALVDKGVLTAKDITDAVVAEPVDEEAVVKP